MRTVLIPITIDGVVESLVLTEREVDRIYWLTTWIIEAIDREEATTRDPESQDYCGPDSDAGPLVWQTRDVEFFVGLAAAATALARVHATLWTREEAADEIRNARY